MANYKLDPDVLLPYLPAGTEPDLFAGNCYVSLVGFLFRETRLMGFRVPFHISFEEVNLRFYVQHTDSSGVRKRGVVFIKELVPRHALSFVANTFYGEHYQTLPMRHKWHRSKAGLVIAYRWRTAGAWQKIQVVAEPASQPIVAGSEAEFITEHYWGYTRLANGRTSEYEVVHPRWELYPVLRYTIDSEFAVVYGPRFAPLDAMQPVSVMLVEGSEVTVRSGSKIALRPPDLPRR